MQEVQFKLYTPYDRATTLQMNAIGCFLEQCYKNVNKQAVEQAIEQAMKVVPSFGGTIVVAYEGNTIVGAAITNKTGMDDFFPANLLLFLGIAESHENGTLRQKLIDYTKRLASGKVACAFMNGKKKKATAPTQALVKEVDWTIQYV